MNTHEALIEGQARVVGVEPTLVWLQAMPPAACGSCATRQVCASSSTPSSSSRWSVPHRPGNGAVALALGDTVRVGVDRRALTRASLTAYALPLVTLLITVLALQDAPDAVAAAAALAGLLAGVAIARQLARRWQTALRPQLLGRVVDSAPVCTPNRSQ